MSSRETLAMYGLAFFLFLTNLPCVEDILYQGTCDRICTPDKDIDEESRNMLATGSLAKFRVLTEEQVQRVCADQTDAKNSSATASLWLKMAAGSRPRNDLQGRLQLVTQTILEGIFWRQFVFGAFYTLLSGLYFVERVANYTKQSGIFLTLLRTERNTRLSVGVTSSSGSLPSGKSAKDNELIFTDEWLAVAIIISIVVLLYFPAIFIFFRPSEIKLKVLRKKRKAQENTRTTDEAVENADPTRWVPDSSMPIQDTRPPSRQNRNSIWGYNIEPPEHDGMTPSQSDNNSAGSLEGSELAESLCDYSLSRRIQHGDGATPGYSGSAVVETKRPSDRNSEITLQRRYRPKALRRKGGRSRVNVNMLKERFGCLGCTRDLPQNLDDKDDATGQDRESATKYERFSTDRSSTWDVRPLRSETPPTGSFTIISDVQKASASRSNRIIEEPSAANSLNDAELASTALQSDRSIEEQRAANSLNETRVDIADIDQPSAEENEEETEEETEYVLAIIVEDSYPVGFGSWIGNKLFSTTHERNIARNVFKLIFMISALPILIFLLLGDLFLFLFPKLHSRLSDHFPATFLTRSLGYGIINNHPMLLIPIVVSAFFYLIRLLRLCFLSSSTLRAAWQSCSVRMHPTCFACKLLQYFFSEPPSSLNPCENCCNPAPSECSKYLDLPENISHNLEKQPDIFILGWESFSDFWRRRRTSSSAIGILLLPVLVLLLIIVIIIFIIIGIFCTSPLVCLCHGRWRLFGSRVIEYVVMIFSLVWVTIFSLLCAIPLGVATVGLIKVLGNHTSEVLPQVTIAALALHYFWSCYKSFRAPYRCVAESLASRYQVSYCEEEKKPGVNALIHYKQGDLRVLPKELFDDGCKEFKLSIKNDVALLFVRLVCTLLAFCFVFPILGSDDVSDPNTTSAIATFLAVAYIVISDAINREEFQISKEVADNVVDDYIARKQWDSS